MYSYRFLIGVALVVLLGGAVTSIDLALAGAQPAWTLAQGDVQPVARMIGPQSIDGGLDSATGQLQLQGGLQGGCQGGLQLGGLQFQGGIQFGGCQGGGLQFQGGLQGGLQGGCQGGLQLGGLQLGGLQLGGCQGGLQGGLQFQGGINSPVAAGGNGSLFAVTGHLNCRTLGEVVTIEVILSQSATGAVATGETRVLCTGSQPSWSGMAVAVGPAAFLPGLAQACALGVGPVTRTQWCRQGGVTLLPGGPIGGPPPVIVLPPPPLVLPLPPPPVLIPGPFDPAAAAGPAAAPAP